MREILQAKLARLSDLERALADPALVNDRVRYREVNQEYAQLRELGQHATRYLQMLDGLQGARSLLESETDPEMRALAKDELTQLEAELPPLERTLKELLLPRDPDDSRDAILEVRAGTGGEEAALFAQEVARMYQRYAERRRWKMEMLQLSASATGGIKEAIFSLQGENAYGTLRNESGVHRVQRVPVTESSGRIHTSACSVAVLPEAEEVEVQISPQDLRIDVFRSGGPGGQSVKTTDSAVRVTHVPTGMIVICQDEKSQHKNKAKALKVLRARLYERARSEQLEKEAAARRQQVGTGDRSEKIRTYNFPQSRVTDHRVGYTTHNLQDVLDGNLDELLQVVIAHFRERRLAQSAQGQPSTLSMPGGPGATGTSSASGVPSAPGARGAGSPPGTPGS